MWFSPYHVEYGYFMFFLNIVEPDKLTLEEPDDQNQQCFFALWLWINAYNQKTLFDKLCDLGSIVSDTWIDFQMMFAWFCSQY